MKEKNLNRDKSFDADVYKNLKPPYERSKEDVWFYMEQEMNRSKATKEVNVAGVGQLVLRYAIAAILVLMVGIPAFMRFYTTTVATSYGERAQVTLPDGSKVQLNAVTEVSYHPYWWQYSRKVELEGEAYFDVEKGNKFTVVSEFGRTTVLGTTFNIFAREDSYEVACFSGLVKVDNDKESVYVNPGEQAISIINNGFEVNNVSEYKEIMSWRNHEYYFTNKAIKAVFSELELQYNIFINTENISAIDTLSYTGNFKRDLGIENILNLVCKPFGLEFEKTGEKEYQIKHVSQ